MLTFFSDCAGLFTSTFNAACSLEFFKFLAAFLLLETCFGLFLYLHHGMKRM
ncbi:MAG: hypothetical protein VB071_14380 [Lawsonibacter sp.]|nr:hypothetical protein [Lawsonibacter sp.]